MTPSFTNAVFPSFRSALPSFLFAGVFLSLLSACGDDGAAPSDGGAAGSAGVDEGTGGKGSLPGESKDGATGGGSGANTGGGGAEGPCADVPPDVLCDARDGRLYPTVEIGKQVWMAENLDYDPGDGTKCPGDQPELCDDYGFLYDWPTALDGDEPSAEMGPQGLCPDGSHLPTDAEWEELALTVVDLLDEGEIVNTDDYANIAPAFMATTGWQEGSGSAPTNSTGFSALPAGQIDQFGKSFGVGSRAWWWSSTQATEAKSPQGYTRNVWNAFDTFWRIYTPEGAFLSVRCVLD